MESAVPLTNIFVVLELLTTPAFPVVEVIYYQPFFARKICLRKFPDVSERSPPSFMVEIAPDTGAFQRMYF